MGYPRILIVGQTFNDFSGGGITLTNLFSNWPKETLASLSYPFMLHNSTTAICNNYYQLGLEEWIWKFPFSLFKQKFQSGKLIVKNESKMPILKESGKVRHSIASNILSPLLRWTGLVHCISSIHLSKKLKDWLQDFAPEVLYLQISNRESINFVIELIDYLKIPSVIHMMDDWPSTISFNGPFSKLWHKRIDREFRTLLDKVDLHLSISDAMSEEYLKRYGKVFKAFHNPVDISAYNDTEAAGRTIRDKYRILYFGRVGVANRRSLSFFAKAISDALMIPVDIEFDIYTKDFEDAGLSYLKRLRNVKLYPPIDHRSIPSLIKQYDLLLLPLDFTSTGLKFARFSIPTKASEYMLSGKPILVFAPEDTSVSKFFAHHNCGVCVNQKDIGKIKLALKKLFFDTDYVNNITDNAIAIARERFDGEKVRSEFQTLISNATISTF